MTGWRNGHKKYERCWILCQAPIITAMWKAEKGGLLVLRSLKPAGQPCKIEGAKTKGQIPKTHSTQNGENLRY